MKHHIRTSTLVFIMTTLLVVGAASTFVAEGQGVEGKVLVFKTELSPGTVFDNPQGCTAFPLNAHILVNQTNVPIKVFPIPGCAGLSVTAQPGWGGHVPPTGGSFSP